MVSSYDISSEVVFNEMYIKILIYMVICFHFIAKNNHKIPMESRQGYGTFVTWPVPRIGFALSSVL